MTETRKGKIKESTRTMKAARGGKAGKKGVERSQGSQQDIEKAEG
jgi:hypothetical protein